MGMEASRSEMSMELDSLDDSMRSLDLASVEAGAELVVSGEAVSPSRMAELERMFPPESGGSMVATPPMTPTPVAQDAATESCSSVLAPGARLPDDCLLQIFRWLQPWPDLAVVRCRTADIADLATTLVSLILRARRCAG